MHDLPEPVHVDAVVLLGLLLLQLSYSCQPKSHDNIKLKIGGDKDEFISASRLQNRSVSIPNSEVSEYLYFCIFVFLYFQSIGPLGRCFL